MLLQYLKIA